VITLYIENTPCDLINEDIPITRQVHDLTNLETRQGNFSRQFSLPLTSLNKQLLGFPNEVNSLSNIPYTRLNAMLMYNGVQDVGFLSIESASSQFAECVFYSGNTDLFDILGNKTLNDLDLSEYDTKWDISGTGTTFFDVKDATSGVVWPIVDTGAGDVYRALPVDTREINAKVLRPAIFTKSLLQKICDLANYTIQGEFTNDDRYNNELVYVTEQEPKHTNAYNIKLQFIYEANSSQTIISPLNTLISFPDVIVDDMLLFDGIYYNVISPGNYSFQCIFNYEKATTFSPVWPTFIINKRALNGEVIELATYQTDGTDENVNLVFKVEDATLEYGDLIYVDVNTVDSLYVLSGDFRCNGVSDTSIVYTNLFECTGNMPDMPLKDFVRAFMVRYNLLLLSNKATNIIEFVPFKNLYENTAYDWSDKIDSRDRELQFRAERYGQNNLFQYLDDNQYVPGYASGVINVSDTNLKEDAILKQPFGASLDVIRLKGLSCPEVPLYLFDEADIDNLPIPEYAPPLITITGGVTGFGYFLNDIGQYNRKTTPQSVTPRLLYLKQTMLTADPIIYKDGPFSFVSGPLRTEPLAWFWNDTEPYNLSFDSTKTGNSLLTDNYTELEFMLDKMKIVTAQFNLSADDVINHDFTRPVFISYLNAYFYVNAIKDYTPNSLTEVELIRL